MPTKVTFIIFFFLFQFTFSQSNSDPKYLINYISTQEGLPHNYVSQVVSDSLNIKWIASENGLIKYDGTDFYVMKPGTRYPGLKNENIETLFVDSKNYLWIGTKSGGLSRLKIEEDDIVNFNDILLKNQTLRVRSIIEDDKGHIWVGTSENGLFIIDPDRRELIRHFPFKQVLKLLRDSHNNIWVTSQNVLKKYDRSEDTFFDFPLDDDIIEIRTLVEDTLRNCIWIGTATNKFYDHKPLYKFDLKTQSVIPVKTNISSFYFSCFYLDDDNRLWVGTWGQGLYRSNRELTHFIRMPLVYPSNRKKTVKYDIILDIHKDPNGMIWISSDFGGIIKLTENKGFKNLDNMVNSETLKNNMVIHAIYKDDQVVLLGTLRNGLFYGKDFENLSQVTDIVHTKVGSIFKFENYFFIGTTTGTYIIDKQAKIICKLSQIPKATCFFVKQNHELWIGTQQKGLIKLDVSSIRHPKIIEQFIYGSNSFSIGSNRITGIVKDNNGLIWVGSYSGVYLYNPADDSFVLQGEDIVPKLPAIINDILYYKKHLWLSTPDGLFKIKTSEQNLKLEKKLSIDDGLSNDFICGSVPYKNQLWFSTLTNLVRYNIQNDSFLEFSRNDGVYTSQFNIRSIYKDLADTIYVGGSDNVTYFSPDKIKSDSITDSKILLTHLRINNTLVTPNDTLYGKKIIDKNFSYVTHLNLPPQVKSFAVGFNNNDFGRGVSPIYKYKLLGYQNEWVYTKSQNEVNFIGLPPGSYELLLSSSNDSKNWSKAKVLNIRLQYATLLNPIAYLIYALLLLSFVTWIFYLLLKQSKLKNQLKKDQELNEAKFTFFTNISHEFRTPLTLILAPLKDLMSNRNKAPEFYDKLITIDKNATRLLTLINQLLDFRKADHDLLQLKVSKGNIVRFTNEVFLYFKEQAEIKGIQYSFIGKKEHISLMFDRDKMEIVLSNLLSNAFKYTSKGGAITLEINADDTCCFIKLTDSGIGMSKDSASRIFDHFFQVQTVNSPDLMGSGIGLTFSKKIIELHHGSIEVESKPNKGTKFTIKLPLAEKLYRGGEKETVSRNSDKIKNYEKLSLESNDLKPKKKEYTILVVDDNSEIRDYLRGFLSMDYHILEAEDGLEAISMANKKNCDLILCDIMMPKMDGLSACKELKSNISTSHIPIILLTARSANLYEVKGLNIGADDFVSKPFNPYVVKARIASVLKNRAKIREHFLNKIRFEPTLIEEKQNDAESLFLQKVITAVEKNLLNEHFGIETLTDICFMSQSTLYRKIKSLTGLSLTGFIRSIKLKKAAEMILTEDSSLSEISLAAGFNDYKYFRVSFEKQFGCLPSQYKTKMKSVK